MTQSKVKPSKAKRFWNNQDGAVAATYALSLIPVIALGFLAFDYTRLAGMDTELQNAADQAALAGATQLDRQPGSIERAVSAIQGGLVENSTLFSNDGGGSTVNITNAAQIVFYSTRADAEADQNRILASETGRYEEAGFVQVIVDTRAANYTFTPVVGALSGDITAAAVAGLGSAICRIPPLMICNPDEPLGGDRFADFDVESRKGFGLLVVRGENGQSFWQPGNFGYLDLGNGNQAIREGLGWISPGGNCVSVNGVDQHEVDTRTGLRTDATDSMNTRFDLYDNVACPDGGQCPSAFNARKDLVRDANSSPSPNNNSCRVHGQGWHEPADQYLPTSQVPLLDQPADPDITNPDPLPTSMGHPRDICHALSNGGSCSNGPIGDGVWDRDAYFHVHYQRADGSRWSHTDWTTNTGLGVNASRYDVYRWEETNQGAVIDGVEILGPLPNPASGSTDVKVGTPVCSQQEGYSGTFTQLDRRRVSVAVINCIGEEVNGSEDDVRVQTWIDVFLVQPSVNRARTQRAEIYTEIIERVDLNNDGSSGGPIIRRDQPYLLK